MSAYCQMLLLEFKRQRDGETVLLNGKPRKVLSLGDAKVLLNRASRVNGQIFNCKG